MRGQLSITAAAVGVVLAAGPLPAHHSFAAEFDGSKPITLKGTVTKLDWINPHGQIHVDVKGPDGKVINWAIETAGPNALLSRGVSQSDFSPGVEIVVKGYLAKNGTPTVAGTTVTLADGRDFAVGSSGP